LLLPAIFGYEVNVQNVWYNALFKYAMFGSRTILKFVRKSKLAKQVSWFKKLVQKGQTAIRFIMNPQAALTYVVNKTTYKLKKVLLKKFNRKTVNKVIRILRKGIKFSIKSGILITAFVKSKDKKEFVLNRLKQVGIKGIKKFSKSIIKSTIFKKFKKFKTRSDFKNSLDFADQSWISFKGMSKWIDGLKIASDNWIYEKNEETLSYFVFFNPSTTNNKKSLLFFNRPIDEFKDFLDAPSKGQYYLDNLAWGWTVGAAINGKTKFSISKLENTKYSQHFLSAIKEFDKNSKDVVENLKDNFKVLSSARNRKLGNKIVIEWNDDKVSFLDRKGFQTEEKYDKFFSNRQHLIKKISKPITLVKSVKKL
ncbi:hypothetical protein, partial [Metamycoplasma auris]